MVTRTWAMAIPALLTLALLTLYPLSQTVLTSLTDAKLGTMDHPSWIGLENYRYLLHDDDWWRAAGNTALFASISVMLETAAGLLTALLLNARLPGQGVARAAILIPWAIPAVVSARIWAWMFNDIYGVVNHLLSALGISSGNTAWLAEPRLALATLVIVDVWKTTPFMALLLLAGLQSIPTSLYEASSVDGAGPWQRFRHVTLPLLRPAMAVAILFRLLDALRVFDLPYVLTSNSKSSAVVSTFARQQLVDFQDFGYGSAVSVTIFVFIAVVACTYLYASRERLE